MGQLFHTTKAPSIFGSTWKPNADVLATRGGIGVAKKAKAIQTKKQRMTLARSAKKFAKLLGIRQSSQAPWEMQMRAGLPT
jgi:hypothetical protein